MSADGDTDDEDSAGGEVVSSLDRSRDVETFVIADVSTDDAWIATPSADTVGLVANR